MFNLIENISNWKNNLKSKDSFTNDNIEELESHLYEQISELKLAGLNDEEAYWVSQKRIGSIHTLAGEFEKINLWEGTKKRLLWMIVGFITLGIITHSMNILSNLSYAVCIYFDINLITWTYFVNILQVSIIILFFILVIWMFNERSLRLLTKINVFYNEAKFLKYFSVSSAIIFTCIIFFSLYGLNWLSIWRKYYVQSDIYREHISIITQFSYISWIVSTIMVFIVLFYGYKNHINKDLKPI